MFGYLGPTVGEVGFESRKGEGGEGGKGGKGEGKEKEKEKEDHETEGRECERECEREHEHEHEHKHSHDGSVVRVSKKRCVLRIYVLYVTDVLESWPEHGRARKVVTIEEAIEEVRRPELKRALREVRERGLHFKDWGGEGERGGRRTGTRVAGSG